MSEHVEISTNTKREPVQRAWAQMRFSGALIAFLPIAGYFLFTEHRAHAVEYLPYALLLACPLTHLFMHRGHGHGGNDDHRRQK